MNIIKDKKLLTKKSIAGFIIKPDGGTIKDKFFEIKEIFEQFNIKVLCEKNSAKELNLENGIKFSELCKKVDFLVTLGGDGTLISASRRATKYQKAVMGINLGKLGFLTDIMPNELVDFLKEFQDNKYRIDKRMMIEASIINKKKRIIAFNDIVITKKDVTGMINIDAIIDGKVFNNYNGDGVIISTPTGSTAYNMSCNGPIVFPLTDAFIVTSISPHSLTQRPLVLPYDFTIIFKNKDEKSSMIIIDGHDKYKLKKNETIMIKIASQKANLIHKKERNYFEILNKKLHWGAN